MSSSDFYLRYYVGHKGKFGHEFLEFEFRPDGKLRLSIICFSFVMLTREAAGRPQATIIIVSVLCLSTSATSHTLKVTCNNYGLNIFTGKLRYANNSNYKNDVMIRKEVICNYKHVVGSKAVLQLHEWVACLSVSVVCCFISI